MSVKIRHIFISLTFLGIFAAKMMISGAPVLFSSLDKRLMSNVIMQLEEECKGESTKDSVKFADQKLLFDTYGFSYHTVLVDIFIPISFFEHSRRYVDPYHPSVPTPPPNFC